MLAMYLKVIRASADSYYLPINKERCPCRVGRLGSCRYLFFLHEPLSEEPESRVLE